MTEKVLLLDGHSIANRAFFGVPLLSDSKGVYTNAVFGFFSILWKVMDEEKPDRLAVAFDTHAPTFRHEIAADYKGTRSPMQEELRHQIPLIRQMLEDAGIPVFSQAGLEADDIIGTLAKRYGAAGKRVSILSGDRDLLQLVDENITLLIPKTKKGGTEVEVYHEAEMLEKYGVSPAGFLQMKALMGDSSDNIPGVPGVGEKTASKLIASYGSLEGVLAHKEEAGGPKLVQNLTDFAEQARLSLVLATIKTDCELTGEAVLLDENSFATDAFVADLKAHELKSLLSRVLAHRPERKSAAPAEKTAPAVIGRKTESVSSPEGFRALCARLPQAGSLAMEAFTDSRDGLILLALGWREGKEERLVLVEPGLPSGNLSLFDGPEAQLSPGEVIEGLRSFAENSALAKLSFDTKKICRLFLAAGIRPRNIAFDAMVAAYLLNPTKGSYAPDELSEAYLNEAALSEAEVLGTGAKKQDLRDLPAGERLKYCLSVPHIVLGCEPVMTAQLADAGMERLYYDIELPLTEVLADMENNGIRADTEVLRSFGVTLSAEIERLSAEIYALAGEEFNINSPKQLGDILFGKLGLPGDKKTKTGYSTAADILERLAPDYPIVRLVLNYRQLTKLNGTYVEGLGAYIQPEDGRIHTRFNQTITATGRLSSVDPNLQNIPIRTELGRELRKAFVPENRDFLFMDADYSQIELRLLAHMSEDEKMIAAYREGQDIHRATAASVLHKAPEDVTPQERSSAKAVNFGIIYGQSAFGLSDGLDISIKDAADYIRNYFAQYPKVEGFLNECVQKAKESGVGVTLYGRRRPIDELKNSNFIQRSFGERVAKNMPIQGTAADIMKIAMVRVYGRLKAEGLKSRLLVQVHDELLVEVYRPEEEAVRRILEEEMCGAASLLVPLEVDVHTGENWYEAK